MHSHAELSLLAHAISCACIHTSPPSAAFPCPVKPQIITPAKEGCKVRDEALAAGAGQAAACTRLQAVAQVLRAHRHKVVKQLYNQTAYGRSNGRQVGIRTKSRNRDQPGAPLGPPGVSKMLQTMSCPQAHPLANPRHNLLPKVLTSLAQHIPSTHLQVCLRC